MQRSRFARNLYISGDQYLEGFLGLSWFPSQTARTNADNYESWVNWTLNTVWSRFTGSRVIMTISARRGTVTIIPRDATPDPTKMFERFRPPQDLICNAEGKPLRPKDARIAGTPWFEDGKDYPTTTATGLGSDAIIPINPWLFAKLSCGSSVPVNRADFVLIHELMHGLASLSGRMADYEPAPRPFDNLEEFSAIVIGNIYISESGGTDLVGGHHDEILPRELMSGQAFYNAYKEPLQRMCANQGQLVRELRNGVNIPHNPLLFCDL
jgi:hypothetical protein